ncbi:MAG: hypothetical protein RRY29_05915 [Desulfovibrionaceae bacterium]
MDDGTLLLILFSIFLGATCWYFYKKHVVLSSSHQATEQRKKIAHALLERSIDQRAQFRLENSTAEKNSDTILGNCIKITPTELFVAVDDTIASINLIEQFVKIYFSITLKRKRNYFQCTTKVLDAKRERGSLIFRLAMPKIIDTGQKRNFVRVNPHKDAVLALALWPQGEQDTLPARYAELEPAVFQYRPNRVNQITLENISGGGMRLILAIDEKQKSEIDLSLGGRLLILIVLRSDDTQKPMPFWVVGKIRMISELKSPVNSIAIGISYTNWAILEQGKSTPISWFPADESGGIAPLATWTMRHHLEQHKKL